jgi:hypothetical protein
MGYEGTVLRGRKYCNIGHCGAHGDGTICMIEH